MSSCVWRHTSADNFQYQHQFVDTGHDNITQRDQKKNVKIIEYIFLLNIC